MPRIIFEGFASTAEAKEFGSKVLGLVPGWTYKPGQVTYDGDVMCEVAKVQAPPKPAVEGATPEMRNFNYLKATLGEDAAYDYLIKHVQGGANMVRDMFANREESARIVNKYAIGAQRGFIIKETNEYVLGGNPFTKQGGQRVTLPN